MKALSLLLSVLIATAAVVRAADVVIYAVSKTQTFTQTATAAPSLPLTSGFTFAALINARTPTSVTGGTLLIPGATVKTFGPVPGFGQWAVVAPFNDLAAMNAVYAPGNYRFTINAVTDGTRTPTLAFNGSSFSSTPTVTNIVAAQNIDWTQDFPLQWSAFTGGTTTNTIQLIINRKDGTQLFATPQYPATGYLKSTNTSVAIPANTFVPGETYSATLAFANLVTVDPFSYGFFDGVPGVATFIKITNFPMKAPGTTPLLGIAKGAAPGSYDLTWNSDIGRTYDLTWSADFTTWTRVDLVTATAATTTRSDTPAAQVTARFYRLQEPP